MKIPNCKICGISLKCRSGRIAGRVLVTQKGKRDKPVGYCFEHAQKWDPENNRMVEFTEERWRRLLPEHQRP